MKLQHDWVAHYLKIARVALADRKALLEKLGVSARGGKMVAGRLTRLKLALYS